MKNRLALGALTLALVLFSSSAFVHAADKLDDVTASIGRGDFSPVKPYLAANPSDVDSVVRSLLVYSKDSMGKDPARATEGVALAESFATKITPPGVPMICSNVRDVVQALPADSKNRAPGLYGAVMNASQSFAKAPVVVSAGRPNLCEEAWLEDAELAQQPGFSPPTLPVRLPKQPDNPASPQ